MALSDERTSLWGVGEKVAGVWLSPAQLVTHRTLAVYEETCPWG